MIITIETHEREKYQSELNQYFQLRKRIFHDQLKWRVPVFGSIERDELDDQPCTYILALCDGGEVIGGARLIPTSQKTLFDLAFDQLLPSDERWQTKNIWEISRFCVDHDRTEYDMSASAKSTTLALMIAKYDFAVQNEIDDFIAVVEPRMFEFTRKFNKHCKILSEEFIDGAPIYAARFPISYNLESVADKVRSMVQPQAPKTQVPQTTAFL